MTNTLKRYENRQVEKLSEGKEIPKFSPGDTIKVNVRIKEGSRERVQAYEGVCIARHSNDGDLNATFTVRKISLGEGVERVFPLYSPRIDSIDVVRRGSVRRAKLYYLRDRRGKSARISERTGGRDMKVEVEEDTKNMTQTAKRAAKKAEKAKNREVARKEQEKIKADKKTAKAEAAKAKAAEAAAAQAPAEEAKSEE